MIRRVDFGYNDEYYVTYDQHLGDIEQVYTDKTQAEIAYKALVVQALQDNDLEAYSFGYGEAPEKSYEAVEALVLEKTGEEYDKDDGIPELDEDGLFQFAQLTGILHYQLIEIDENEQFYVIWLPQSESYFTDYDTGNIFSGNTENFIADHDEDWYFLQEISTTLAGSLEDLSDAPQLLQAVIDKSAGLNYAADKLTLEIDGNMAGYTAITELNALLKQPLFEIQAKSLEEFQTL